MTRCAEDSDTVRRGHATKDATILSPPAQCSVLTHEEVELENVLLMCPGTVLASDPVSIDIYGQ